MNNYANAFLSYFTSTYELKGWMISIICFFAFLGLIGLIKIAFKSKPKEEYIEDTIYDVIWRWKWRKEEIHNLHAFCPTCEDMLVYDDSPCRGPKKETHFICEHCDQTKTTIPGGDNTYSSSIIKREINRRIRVLNNQNLTN